MSGLKITQYTNSATALTAGDKLDVSKLISTSPDVYESQQVDADVLPTIYFNDGTLSANRIVTMATRTLTFSNGNVAIKGAGAGAATYRLNVYEDALSIAQVISHTAAGLDLGLSFRSEITGANNENRGVSSLVQNGANKNTAVIGRAGVDPTVGTPSGNTGGLFHANRSTAGDNYGIYAQADGAGTNNYAAYLSASGGTNNYGLVVAAGFSGFGISAPSATLHAVGTARIFDSNSEGISLSASLLSITNDTSLTMYAPSVEITTDAGGYAECWFTMGSISMSFGHGSTSYIQVDSNNIYLDTTSLVLSQLTASTVPVLNASKQVISSAITPTELGYLSGTTSNLQAQISALVSNLYWKDAVRVATTANITLSGTQTIDGVAVAVNDRVLVKDQTTASENGIYVVSAGAWTRATDFDAGADKIAGATVAVQEGTLNMDLQYVCTNDDPIAIGSDNIAFVLVGGTTYVGTTNRITVTGNVIDIAAAFETSVLSRANHTGTQLMATISDAGNAATKNVGTTAGTVAAGDHTHTGYGFTMYAGCTNTTVADSTTYYVGGHYAVAANTGAANILGLVAPRNCTLKHVHIHVIGGAASSENVTYNVRVNNTTSTLIGTSGSTLTNFFLSNNAMNVALVQGDYIHLEIITPAWVTNPVGVRYGATFYFE